MVVTKSELESKNNETKKAIDLFSLGGLLSHFRLCHDTLENSCFQIFKTVLCILRGLKWEKKPPKLKKSIGTGLTVLISYKNVQSC